MLHNGQSALVVDPGDSTPVIDALHQHGLKLDAILVTHRHPDHVAGVEQLRQQFKVPVYGPASLTPAFADHAVHEGDQVEWQGLQFKVWATPGHTNEHLSFICDEVCLQNDRVPLVFCGDVLFSCGCGRIFEGQAFELFDSLNRLAQLPEQTKICPAHEYTLNNISFAQAVEPDNRHLAHYKQSCINLRAQGKPTVPTTLTTERQINPFLRSHELEVISAARRHGAADEQPLSIFTALRAWKNIF